MNYTQLICDIDKYLNKNLTKKRYVHSLEVAKMARNLACKFNLSQDKAYISGLLHDIAREKSFSVLSEEILKCKSFSKEFYDFPVLFHGPVGGNLIIEKFQIDDNEIIDAVTYHSIGSSNLGDIGKIIYVADYISLDRVHIDDSYRSLIMSFPLDKMVLTVTDSCRLYLKSKGGYLLPETENMYNKILRITSEKEKGF